MRKNDALYEHLAEHLDVAAFREIENVLRPLQETVQQRRPLPWPGKLDEETVHQALTSAFGHTVKRVILHPNDTSLEEYALDERIIWDKLKSRYQHEVGGYPDWGVVGQLQFVSSIGVTPWDRLGVIVFFLLGLTLTRQEIAEELVPLVQPNFIFTNQKRLQLGDGEKFSKKLLTTNRGWFS